MRGVTISLNITILTIYLQASSFVGALPVSLPQPALSLQARSKIDLQSTPSGKEEQIIDILERGQGRQKQGQEISAMKNQHRKLDTLKLTTYYDGKECAELYWLNFAVQHLYSKVYYWCAADTVVMESCDLLSDIAVQSYEWMNYANCQLSNVTDYELISTSDLNLMQEQTKLDFSPTAKVTKGHLQNLMSYEMQKAVGGWGMNANTEKIISMDNKDKKDDMMIEVGNMNRDENERQFDFTHLKESLSHVYERSAKRKVRLSKMQAEATRKKQEQQHQNNNNNNNNNKKDKNNITEELELAFGCFALTSFLCLGVFIGTKYAKFASIHGRR